MDLEISVRTRSSKEPDCMRERVLWLRQHLKCTQTEFAAAIGIKRSTVANVESGQQQMTHDGFYALDKAYGPLNMNWFYFGVGSPFRVDSDA